MKNEGEQLKFVMWSRLYSAFVSFNGISYYTVIYTRIVMGLLTRPSLNWTCTVVYLYCNIPLYIVAYCKVLYYSAAVLLCTVLHIVQCTL